MILLRDGNVADLPVIAALMAEAFDPQYGEAWTQAQCMGILSLPGVWLTMAERGGTSVGFALARSVLEDAELLLLATAPHVRRGGIGSSLLRSVIADAQGRGAHRLLLEVRAGNPAIDLYVRHGLKRIGTRANYYRGKSGVQFDAITFQRDLRQDERLVVSAS